MEFLLLEVIYLHQLSSKNLFNFWVFLKSFLLHFYLHFCRRISDNKNYGDESDGYALISPSIYSKYGLTERDFFMARSPEEVRIREDTNSKLKMMLINIIEKQNEIISN